MAYIIPDTWIQFLNVPFDPDYENTMSWGSALEQDNWMLSHVLTSLGNNSYQRKTKGVLRVGWTADLQVPRDSVIRNLYNSNYMRFKNTNFENKWFYAFVNKVEYVNNNTVDVYYDIDVIQTWYFDTTFNQCMIEREHVTDDTIGLHTVPEGIEHGEYFDTPLAVSSGNQTGNTRYEYTPAVCLITTFDATGDYTEGRIIHGRFTQGDMFSGLYYTIWQLTANNVSAINQTLENIAGGQSATYAGYEVIEVSGLKIPRNLSEGVIALFMMPYEFAGSITGGSVSPAHILGFTILTGDSYLIGSYRPRNKKLMCYPYNMIYITNNTGGTAEYRWEDFNTPLACQFNVWGNVSPTGGLMITPAGYKGYSGENPDEMLQVSGFPMCSWVNDAYKAWVAQNAGTIGASILGIAGQWSSIIAPIATNLGSGAMDLTGYVGQHTGAEVAPMSMPSTGLLGATLGALGQVYDHKRRPPQSHGNGNVSLNFQAGLLTFFFYRKHIKQEYAELIDGYFDMYGYKVNRVGIPNRRARPCYCYVKTIGCAVDGLIPADDCAKIQAIYDKGIRFWKATATFGRFDPEVNPNEIVVGG